MLIFFLTHSVHHLYLLMDSYDVSLAPSFLATYYGKVPLDSDFVLLETTSDSQDCMEVFIQQDCPQTDSNGRVTILPGQTAPQAKYSVSGVLKSP